MRSAAPQCCSARCTSCRTAHRGLHTSALLVLAVAAGLPHVASGFTPIGAGRLEWNLNASIIFGQSAVFSGPNKDLGTLMRRGMIAAFSQHNKATGAGDRLGPQLGLISYDDGYNGIPARDNTIQLIEVDRVFAIIGEVGTPTSAQAAPAAVDRNVPFIGPFTGASFLRTPFERLIINYRASYIDESAAMVRYFTGSKLHLTRISLFRQDDSFGNAVKEGVVKALRERRMSIYSEGTYAKNTVIVTPGLEAMASQMIDPPEAIIMVGTYSALSRFVIEAKARSGWENCLFSTVSFVGPTSLSQQLGTEGNRSNVFITQTVPFPQDTSIELVRSYQSAMTDYFGEDGTPDFTSFEGYIVGSMAASLVRAAVSTGLPDADRRDVLRLREELLNQCYEGGIIALDTFRLGAYGGYCDQNGTGCHCNQGQRQVYGTMINDDGSFSPASDLDFSFSSCGYKDSNSYEIVFGQSAALTGSVKHLGLNMQLGIEAAFYEATSNQEPGMMVTYVPRLLAYDDMYDPVLAVQNTAKLLFEDNVFALVGYVGTPTTAGVLNFIEGANIDVPFIGPFTGAGFLRKDPWLRDVINIRASYTDECAAMVHYYTQVKNFSKISIFGQDDGYGAAGEVGLEIALKAYGLNINTIGRYRPLYSCDNCSKVSTCPCSNVIDAVVDISGTDSAIRPQAIVIFATGEHTVEFVKQMKARPGACDGDCHFAAVSFVGSAYLLKNLDTSELRQNVIITQVVPLYTDVSLDVVDSYQAAIRNYVLSRYEGVEDKDVKALSPLDAIMLEKEANATGLPQDPDSTKDNATGNEASEELYHPEIYDFISLEGYMVGKLIVKVLARLASKARSGFLNKVFETRTFNLADPPDTFLLGPYNSGQGDSEGCNQGIGKVYLTRIVDGKFQYVTQCPTFEFGHHVCTKTAENFPCFSGRYTSPDGSIVSAYQQRYRATQDETCQDCPYGSTTDGRNCTKCAAGRFWKEGVCNPCYPGEFNSQEGRIAECDLCPAGRFQRQFGSSECEECRLGAWREVNSEAGALKCEPCLPGTFRGPNSTSGCEYCVRGRFSSQTTASECESCRSVLIDSITSLEGASREEDCVCDRGYYGTRQGVPNSSEAKGRCVFCGSKQGQDFGLYCPGGRTENGSSIPGETSPSVLPDYMVYPPVQSPTDLPLHIQVYKCMTSGTVNLCPGTHEIWNQAAICRNRRQGVACGHCPHHYFRTSMGCAHCTGSVAGSILIILVLFPLLAWIVYLIVTYFTKVPVPPYEALAFQEEDEHAISKQIRSVTAPTLEYLGKVHRSSSFGAIMYTLSAFRVEMFNVCGNIFKILLAFVQTLGVVMPLFPPLPLLNGQLTPADIRASVRRLARFFSVQLQFINEYLRLDCMTGPDFKALYTVELCAPLFICLCFCFNCATYRLVIEPIQARFKPRLKDSVPRFQWLRCLQSLVLRWTQTSIRWILTFDLLGHLVTTFYISITYLTLALFVTYPHPLEGVGALEWQAISLATGDTRYQGAKGHSVQRFAHVLQGSDEWNLMMPVSIFFFIFYCIGALAVCMWGCWRAPQAVVQDRNFVIKWNFLIGDFHPAVWWWEVVLMIRGLFWNLAIILAPTAQMACVILIVTFALYLAFNFAWRPWGGDYSTMKTVVDTTCNLMICIIVPAMSLRASYTELVISDSREMIYHVESAALGLPVVATVCCIGVPVHAWLWRKKNSVSILNTSQQLKALVLLITRVQHREIHRFWANLNDTDRRSILYAVDVFYSDFLGTQPDKYIWRQRLISSAEEFKVTDDTQILKRIESDLRSGKDDLAGIHERALVQWVLEQLLVGYQSLEHYRAKEKELAREKKLGILPNLSKGHSTSSGFSIYNTFAGTPGSSGDDHGGNGEERLDDVFVAGQRHAMETSASSDTMESPAPKRRDMLSRCCGGIKKKAKKAHHGRRRNKNHVKISHMFREMDQDCDGVIDLEEFVTEGRRLAPLCIGEELTQCFELLDGEGLGYFNEDRFVLLFKGLTFRQQSKLDDKEAEKQKLDGRNALMRISMKARGGEQTIERLSRTAKVRKQLIGFQKRFKARYALKHGIQNLQASGGSNHSLSVTDSSVTDTRTRVESSTPALPEPDDEIPVEPGICEVEQEQVYRPGRPGLLGEVTDPAFHLDEIPVEPKLMEPQQMGDIEGDVTLHYV